MKIKLLLLIMLLSLPVFSLSAFDYGLLLDTDTASEYTDTFSFSTALIPWFSIPLGNGNLFLSARGAVEYEGETWTLVPELMRTEFAYRFDGIDLKTGRFQYSDPLGFIANGLFDGAQVLFDIGEGRLGAGIWYTGLLYKRTANITMTESETASFNIDLDYSDFANTYFAPRRLFAAVDWENPVLKDLVRLKTSLIGQFDLSANENLYHSQYLALKAAIPVKSFTFDLGGCLELAQADELFQFSYAGEFGASWTPPLNIPNKLALLARFSGGSMNDTVSAFVPITTVDQGNILKAKLSGLSMIRLEYTARLHESFSINFQNSYFILSDSETFQGLPAGRDGRFLGDELYGIFIWSPFSDLQFKGGGGIFMPFMGNADPNSDLLWRVEFSMSLAIF